MGEEVPQVSNTVLTGRILIVDDEPDIRRLLVDYLARNGYTALAARDGRAVAGEHGAAGVGDDPAGAVTGFEAKIAASAYGISAGSY
jgi:hypothetical protein